jgi:uncharacterized protein YbbC (DUF1343 family)
MYMWTMSLALEAAAEVGLSFIVLHRPNPINGIDDEFLDKRLDLWYTIVC